MSDRKEIEKGGEWLGQKKGGEWLGQKKINSSQKQWWK